MAKTTTRPCSHCRLLRRKVLNRFKVPPFSLTRVFRLVAGVCFLLTTWKVLHLQSVRDDYNTLLQYLKPKLQGQRLVDYIGTNLRVNYINVESQLRVRLKNCGYQDIPTDEHWAIYFSHIFGLSNAELLQLQGLEMVHVDGWLYCLQTAFHRPNTTFLGIRAGEYVTLLAGASLQTKTYAFPRWYVTGQNGSDLEPRIIENTDSEHLGFVEQFWVTRPPTDRYSDNEVAAHQADDADNMSSDVLDHAIVPTPLSVSKLSTPNGASISPLGTGWMISIADQLQQRQLAAEAAYLSERLGLATNNNGLSDSLKNKIHLRLGNITNKFRQFPYIRSLDEAYVLQVEQDNVLIEGHTSTGVFYGIQSLLSLLERSSNHVSLPVITITDAPRIPFRGLLLDVARNFIQKQDLFKIMDVMAMYKMNKLHLHLTDDQGWRFEVPGLPELTQIGGRRSHDFKQKSSLHPYLGSGPFSTNSAGTGYYSLKDYRDILLRAARLHIEVVPEIDMPGHAHAAIQSMRMRSEILSSSVEGKRYTDFLLSDPDDESEYEGVNGQKDTVVNPCLESTFHFIEHVLSALKDSHKGIQPLRVVHLGGDEVPRAALTKSPACDRFVAQRPEWSGKLKLYFMLRAGHIASRLGLQLQAWDDGIMDASGTNPIPLSDWNATDVFVNTWNNGQFADRSFLFANKGYKVILTHATHLYLDHPQEWDDEEPGLRWATRCSTANKVFDYIVAVDDRLVNVSSFVKEETCKIYNAVSSCHGFNHAENIMGLQVSLWGEMVRTIDQVEYMLYPRLLSAAERAWHVADWETTAVDRADFDRRRQADWRRFASVVGQVELARLERMGVRYRVPPPGVRYERKQLLVNIELPGLPVLYSTDGGSSWVKLPETSSLDISTISPSVGYILFIARSHDQSRTSRSVRVQWPPDDN